MIIPNYIQTKINQHSKAKIFFADLAPSHKRNFIGWIVSAKKEETKQRRLKEAIQLMQNGKILGMK